MNLLSRLAHVLVFFILVFLPNIVSTAPHTINLKTTISEENKIFEGYKRVEVTLYDGDSDTLWKEIHKDVLFDSGSCELELGSISPISSTLIRLSSPNFRLKIDGIESIVTFSPSAAPFALDIPSLWDKSLLGSPPPTEFNDGVIHSDWIITSGEGGVDAELVRNAVSEMVSGNTALGLTVSTAGSPLKLNFDVADPTIRLVGDIIGSGVMSNLGNTDLATAYNTVVPVTKGGTGFAAQAGQGYEALPSLSDNRLSRYSNGNAGLKITGDLWVTGEAYIEGSIVNPGTPSDRRLKDTIRPLTEVSKRLKDIQGLRYHWNTTAITQLQLPKSEQIGVLAQDVEKVFPELISIGPLGYKRVNYELLTAILIQAHHEQEKRLLELESRLTRLEEKASQ
mgnify:CR=1 FL=1